MATENRINHDKLAAVLEVIRDDVCDGQDGDGAAMHRAICRLNDLQCVLRGEPCDPDYDLDVY